MFKKFTHLLAFRLFLIILTVMLVGTAIFTKLSIDRESDQYLHSAMRGANRVADVISRSTNYSMMQNRREDIYNIINTIGTEPGIERIRIYNKKGEITFSTQEGEVGSTVDMTAEACIACHSPGKLPSTPSTGELSRIFSTSKGYRVLGLILPIRNEQRCATSDCHAHTSSQTVLGVLDVMMPLDEIDRNLADLSRSQYLNAFLMVIVMTLATGIFIWFVVNIPIRKLTLGTQEIMKGNLDYRISSTTHDEIGRFAESFNKMTDELKRAREELTSWAQTLEDRVEKKTAELRRAQVNMVQMEKMASLGKLASTVAHELNNPLEGVLTYAKLLKRKIKAGEINLEDAKEIQEELTLISDETARCGNIVKNLLLFSRQKVGEFTHDDIRPAIDRSLKLIEHHLHMHNIKLETDFSEERMTLYFDPQQIEQAILAIELNAIDAMPDGGTLRLSARAAKELNAVHIAISDTGIGIPPEIMPSIFEPFFTTKEHAKGTGLGLAVAYGIVERHNGKIDVASEVNNGTTFTITLPIDGPQGKETVSQSSTRTM